MSNPIRVAVLDMYNGEPNQGMRCIIDIINRFNQMVTFQIFDVRGKNEFYLNQNGMIDIDKDQEELTISDFVFSIKKVGKTIYFKSFKGTIWRDMSVVLDDFSYGVINQNGISTKPL